MPQFVTSCEAGVVGIRVDPSAIRQMVQNETSNIKSTLESLVNQADVLESRARSMLEEAADFKLNTFDPIDFSTSFNISADVPSFNLSPPEVFSGLNSLAFGQHNSLPSVNIPDFEKSNIVAPTTDDISIANFSANTTDTNPPAIPTISDIAVSAPPVVDFGDLEAINLPPPPTLSVDFVNTSLLSIPDLTIKEASLDIDSIRSRINAILAKDISVGSYTTKISPDGLHASCELVKGNILVHTDLLNEGFKSRVSAAVERRNRVVTRLWPRLGFSAYSDAYKSTHIHLVDDQYSGYIDDSVDGALLSWRMKILPTAIGLAVEGHAFAAELLGSLYDSAFEILTARQQAMLALYDAVAILYAASLQQAEVALARYRAQIESVIANAKQRRFEIEQAAMVGDLNKLRADVYSATQRAALLDVDRYRAQVAAIKSAAEAYDAEVRAVAAKAQHAKVELEKYRAEIARWSAGLSAYKVEYERLNAENAKIIASNRLNAAKVSITAEEQATDVAAAVASAISDTMANVYRSKRVIAALSGEYARKQFEAQKTYAAYATSALNYRINALSAKVQPLQDKLRNEVVESVNAQTVRLADMYIRSYMRIADKMQGINSRILNAYDNLYSALAQAEAAAASGKVSRYRASVSLSSRGGMRFDDRLSTSVSSSESAAKTQSYSCSTIFEATRY